jgi:hypothetical protein
LHYWCWVSLPTDKDDVSLAPIVGFFPASGIANATAETAMGEGAPATGPSGLFAALLQLVSLVDGETAPATGKTGPALAWNATFGSTAIEAQTEGTATVPQADAGVVPSDDVPTDLLAELSTLLEAIGVAAEGAMPLDPALEDKAIALIEAIAVALGVPVPVVAALEAAAPAIQALAGAAVAGLQAKQQVPVPETATVQRAGEGTSAPPLAEGADGVAPRAAPGGADPALPPAMREFADRLAKLATVLEHKAPALAGRIAELADKIATGEIDLAALARPGKAAAPVTPEDAVHPSIIRLLAAAPDTNVAPPPNPFSAATLAVPP